MDSQLYELYLGNYDIPIHDEKQRERGNAILQLFDQIEETLGADFSERLETLYTEREEVYLLAHYKAGFRLGVRLMLDVFMSD